MFLMFRIKRDPMAPFVPRTVMMGGKVIFHSTENPSKLEDFFSVSFGGFCTYTMADFIPATVYFIRNGCHLPLNVLSS